MANINVTIRIDEELKKNADELFDDLGMSFTTAVNVFVKQCLREGRIPFGIGAPVRGDTSHALVDYGSSRFEGE